MPNRLPDRPLPPAELGQGTAVVSLKALPGQAHYVAAKHGLVGLVKAAAVELGPHLIRVNSIHPWGVDTVMAEYSQIEQKLAGLSTFNPT